VKFGMFGLLTLAALIGGIKSSSALTAPSLAQSQSGCAAWLTAEDPQAQINVRSGPGRQYASPHYGLVGDRVLILPGKADGLAIVTDRLGLSWVKVKFPKSGATGWVRRDLIGSFQCG
jgi:hypothetical protein